MLFFGRCHQSFSFRLSPLRILFYLLPLLIVPLIASNVLSADVSLAWDPNVEPDLAGYKMYYGTSSRGYTCTVDVGNHTTCTISGLEEGNTYYFAATTYDLVGNESDYSAEVFEYVAKADTDGDGIPDHDETDIYGTDPNISDTDLDGISDGDEIDFWGNSWNGDSDGDGIVNLLDWDSDNDGFSDGWEKDENSDPSDPGSIPSLLPIEIGEVNPDHTWTKVELQKSFVQPIVIVKPLSLNDDDPAVVRIRNVDSNGFEVRIQEWGYLDGIHGEETVSYIVMEQGSYTLEDGTLVEAGSFETDNTSSSEVVSLNKAFTVEPVVIAAVTSFNEEDAVTGRIRGITTNGFEYRMQEQELNSQVHATETISYIAWEPSSGDVEGLTFEVKKTANSIRHKPYAIPFDQDFMNIPVFFADMQTTDGRDTANLRWQDKDFSGVNVNISEEQSRDKEINHTTEVLGYMVFDFTD